METYHLLIKGKVQGVFYRDSARKEAKRLGISGWVKNTMEGNVEALITGDENQLNTFVAWCREGPPLAKVDDVIVTKTDLQQFSSFTIEH
jgi:acylphosphatase